jgi:Cytochrome c7 and related cytochrome c
MAQLFPKSFNILARLSIFAVPFLAAGAGAGGAAFYRSDYTTGAREVVEQPIPFSHKHHVAQLGIDCKYCHTSVEVSADAGLPPTKTCMSCHQQVWQSADLLDPLRKSYTSGTPIAWNKVHNVPHYTYFNHSIHVNKGVGCYSCHGEIDEMNLVYQSKTLLMEWCLDCHRNPERHLRPKDEIYNLKFKASDIKNPDTGLPYDQTTLGLKLKELHQVREPSILTNCSMCHR